jgi:hypothetical protein
MEIVARNEWIFLSSDVRVVRKARPVGSLKRPAGSSAFPFSGQNRSTRGRSRTSQSNVAVDSPLAEEGKGVNSAAKSQVLKEWSSHRRSEGARSGVGAGAGLCQSTPRKRLTPSRPGMPLDSRPGYAI